MAPKKVDKSNPWANSSSIFFGVTVQQLARSVWFKTRNGKSVSKWVCLKEGLRRLQPIHDHFGSNHDETVDLGWLCPTISNTPISSERTYMINNYH